MAQRKPSGRRGTPSPKRPGRPTTPQRTKRAAAPRPQRPEPTTILPTFRLGAVEGATPGKWIDRWREQRPHQPLELIAIGQADVTRLAQEGDLDAAIVRLPVPTTGLHTVQLYDEAAVVAMSADSDLTGADELSPDDLAGEVRIRSVDEVFAALPVAGLREASFDPLETVKDVIATVATGIGIAIMPMSQVRLHRRKDVEYRPLLGAPPATMALVWHRDDDAVQAFVGITRGRTVRSSR